MNEQIEALIKMNENLASLSNLLSQLVLKQEDLLKNLTKD